MKFKVFKIGLCLLVSFLLLAACMRIDNSQPVPGASPENPTQPTDPTALPLFSIQDLTYQGAFRLPADTYGSSSLNYSEGPIAYNPTNESLFIVGHAHQQAIAEFKIPALVNDADLSALIMADAPLQAFKEVLSLSENPQNLNRIGGLAVIGDENELLVNAYEYYDAPGDSTESMLLVPQADTLARAEPEGFLEVEGGAGHTSGWLSPIPTEWQPLLGGSYLTGQSSGIPIISRTSVGPSAFAFNPDDVLNADASTNIPIPTTKLLDFSLGNPLHSDLSNETDDNKLWTHLSRVTYGFVVPGTRSYLTLGYSGGHESGVCYKCVQDDGNRCGGYCTPNANDNYSFYWLWDMNDLLAVKNGEKNSFDVRPYAYGELALPFGSPDKALGGGAFDPATGQLYLSVQRADDAQGRYSNPPVVVVYNVD